MITLTPRQKFYAAIPGALILGGIILAAVGVVVCYWRGL